MSFDFSAAVEQAKQEVDGQKKLGLILLAPSGGGKCLEGSTLVMTELGARPINSIKPGDRVYGYNYDGSTSLTEVVNVHNNGLKDVVEVVYRGKKLFSATKDHTFLVDRRKTGDLCEKKLGDIVDNRAFRLVKHDIDFQGGSNSIPYAYAIGALLGDGCSLQGSANRVYISSENELIVNATAGSLDSIDIKKNSGFNYTYSIGVTDLNSIPEYLSFCNYRRANEKKLPINELITWDKDSLIKLMSGLIDTDGSIITRKGREASLAFSYTSTSKSLIDGVRWILSSVWQIDSTLAEDNREGRIPCYNVKVSDLHSIVKMVRDCDKYMVTPRKKFQEKYEAMLNTPQASNTMEVSSGKTYKTETYDLELNNETHMFALASRGIITHNSTTIGTLGVKTLYLYARGESHGVTAASTFGGQNIIPVCIDRDNEGNVLNPGQTRTRVLEILDSVDEMREANIEAIAIDSLTELEAIIKGSPVFTNMVAGNKFKETDVTVTLLREIILKLVDLQAELNIHYIVTCILDAQKTSDSGEIVESQPRLVGYRVADSIVQLFPDVAVVSPMTNGEEVQHRLQFMAGVTKEQKDQAGSIKKTTNFRPRITGTVLRDVLTEGGTLEADLSKLATIKAGE